MIKLEGITKSYPGHGVVVDHVSLDVAEGECLVLIGTSGGGKSTVLKIINGLVQPDEGDVFIEGRPLDRTRLPEIRRKMGYVIQQGGLFPHLTVADNISLVARLCGWSRTQREERLLELLAMVNLKPEVFWKKYPAELSGGEQQRVGVARALMLNPPILLMDEPFGALDPITRRQLQKDFLKLQTHFATKKTIIFVTHDMAEAVAMASRIAVIDQGKILHIGTPNEVGEYLP